MRTTLRSLVLITTLLVSFASSEAQPSRGSAYFQRLTVDDGLPENSVRAIVEDPQGFLWFGTHAGVVRYDGHEMVSYWKAASDSLTVPNLIVSTMAQDVEGMIWIGTLSQGLWRLDPTRGRIDPILCEHPDRRVTPGQLARVGQVSAGRNGEVWVAWNGGGLCRIGDDGACMQHIMADLDDPRSLPSNDLNAVFEDSKGNLWVGSNDHGLALRAAGSTEFSRFVHEPGRGDSLPNDQVNAIYEAPDGRVWITTFQGLCTWLPRSRTFRSYLPDPKEQLQSANYLLPMDSAADGGLWIGSAVGLYHFDPLLEEFELYAHDPEDPRSPVKGPALSVLRDRSGIVWAGSWHAGLNKLDPDATKFLTIRADRENPHGLDDDAIMAIVEDARGALWVGTGSMSTGGSNGGLNRRLPGGEGFEQLDLPRQGPDRVRSVESLQGDPAGNLWVGTDNGLWFLAAGTRKAVRVDYRGDGNAPGAGATGIRELLVDRDGQLWLCTAGAGLWRYDPRTGRRHHYEHDPDDPDSLSDDAINFAYQDSRGLIWVGGDTRGLEIYRPETDDFRRVADPQGQLNGLISIHEDARGRIWVGSLGGLQLVDPERGSIDAFTREDGLPHDHVGAILDDDRGRLWMSTGRGVARVDPETREVRSYNMGDGLPAHEISFKAWRDSHGTFWFGGNHGLIHFHPEELKDNAFQPNVVLTALRIGDELQLPSSNGVLTESLPYTGEIDLTHGQNDLGFTFAALDFAHPERNRYRYRLIDYDQGWREAGTRRSATYTNLAPGDYRFEVQGSNSDGVFSPSIAALDVRIAPPWWMTAWARLLYIAVALSVVMVIYRQVVQRERMQAALQLQRSEAEQLQDLDRFKSRFFANISHEFRTPLTLIQAPLQRLTQDPTGGDRVLFEMMNRNAHRLGDLIDQLLDLSRLEAKRLPMRWQHGDWLSYLRTLLNSFESLAHSRNLQFAVETPSSAQSAWYDSDVIEKVVSNLLSNAFRYTPDGGAVNVRVGTIDERGPVPVPATSNGEAEAPIHEVDASHLWLEVANSGSYIPPADQERIFDRFHQVDARSRGGSGIGLALVKELVDWMHGTVSVTSDRDTGTCFRLVLPLFQDPPVLGLEPASDEDLLGEDEDSEENLRAIAAAAGGGAGTESRRLPEPTASEDAPVVLVVEDHAELRAFLVGGMANKYRVLEAVDGLQGLEVATTEIPDLILSDVMMPNMDGVEMCERIKTDERTSHIPVILLTAKVEIESRRAGLQVGADDYVPKPFDLRELEIRVQNLVQQRKLLAEKYASRVIALSPEAMPVTSADERFLARARQVVEEHLDDPELNVDTLCREIALSRAQLHRKLKALTGYSTKEFVRIHRLQRAASLLKGRYGNVTEVAYAVGFQSLSYFSRAFREQYGESPSEYLDKHS